MSKPIQVGDLVQIVRACCERRANQHGGKVFRVGSFIPATVGCACGWRASGTKAMAESIVLTAGDWIDGAPVGWLKRIPPLDEMEGVKSEEKLREPA